MSAPRSSFGAMTILAGTGTLLIFKDRVLTDEELDLVEKAVGDHACMKRMIYPEPPAVDVSERGLDALEKIVRWAEGELGRKAPDEAREVLSWTKDALS